jgi:hypothetical protein
MSERVVTKDGLMSHIERDWNALISWLKTLTPNQLSEIRNAEGWALKDHVAHMATWENYALFFIQRQPGHEGLGIPQEVYLREDLDEMNALIFQKHKDVPYDVSWQRFMSIHAQLLDLLAPLTTEDLMQPYVYYLPDEPGGGDGPPALNVVYGNTAHHYRLHQGWMEAMLREAQ